MKIFFVILALAVIQVSGRTYASEEFHNLVTNIKREAGDCLARVLGNQQASACCGCGGSCGCKSKKPSLEITYESCGCGSYQPAPITASILPYSNPCCAPAPNCYTPAPTCYTPAPACYTPAPAPCYAPAPAIEYSAYAAPAYSSAPVTAIVQEYDYAAYNPCGYSAAVAAPVSYSALSYPSAQLAVTGLEYPASYGCGCASNAVLEYSAALAPISAYSACAPASLPLPAPVLPYPAPALPAPCGCAPPAVFPFKGCVPATICF